MLNKLYLLFLLTLTVACNSGGGGSSGGGSTPEPKPNNIELTRNFNLQPNQALDLGLESDSGQMQIEKAPTKGTLNGVYPDLTYSASANASGSDQAIIFITKTSSTKRIKLNFYINKVPVAENFSVSVLRGNGLSFDLRGSDSDGDTLTYTIIQEPSMGRLYHTTSGKEVAYDAPNFTGTSSFFYQVSDGKSLSNIGKVDIIIAPSLPVINSPTTYSLNEDTATNINVTATDSGSVTFSISKNPINGVISGSNGNFVYTPNLNYNGTDSFIVKATNSSGGFSEKTINLTINPINDAPVFNNQSMTVMENLAAFIIADASDPEGSNLNFTIESEPEFGFAEFLTNRINYFPAQDFYGLDSFTVKACDNGSPILCSSATISVIVTRLPKAPIAQDKTFYTTAGESISITLPGIYANLNAVSSQILTQTTKGSLVHNGGLNYTYTPNVQNSEEGSVVEDDFFSFTLSEDGFVSNQAVVTITISYTYNYLGLDLDGGFKELSFLSNILHQDIDLGYYIGKNTSTTLINQEPMSIEQTYVALKKEQINCSESAATFLMISLSSYTLAPGEKFTIDGNYSCVGDILRNNTETEDIYLAENIALRYIKDFANGRLETQLGIKVNSLANKTTLNDLLSLNLGDIQQLSLSTVSKNTTTDQVNLDSLILEYNIAGQSTSKYFFKSKETIIDYFNEIESLDIYHEIQESNGELKLVNKYYFTESGMVPLQELLTAWFQNRAEPSIDDEPLTINQDAGRILILNDVVIVRIQEKISSFYESVENDPNEPLTYLLDNIDATIEIYNQKL